MNAATLSPPGWMRQASCRREDPTDWDTDRWAAHARGGVVRALDRDMAVAQLCADCPVAAQCAADALDMPVTAVGVVRAGVPLPDYPRSRSRRQLDALAAIAGGARPDAAVFAGWVRDHPTAVRRWVKR